MLAVLIAQVGSGLLSDDEIAFSGPLSRFVPGDTVALATAYHAHWGQYLLYALVALHLLAILFYAWRGRGLVRAMVTGDKQLPEPLPASRDTAATRLLALALAAAAGLGAWWVQQLGSAF
jgi:cytochrome b